MPLKVVRVLISFLFILSFTFTLFSQSPNSVDVMRDRISKAKANLVIKNYSAAIYELENIRRETNDRTIHRVVNVLLMHSYLEQGDYKRTQKFLQQLYKSKKPHAAIDYLAIAGQVVSGAKTQLKRYQSLGLSVSDEKLPSVASADINNMRKTLELVVTHSKTLSKNKKLTSNSLALLEETTNARAEFARDVYDAKRWENEISDTREQLASSGSKVINVIDDASIKAPDVNIVDAEAVVKNAEKAANDKKTEVPDSNTVAKKNDPPNEDTKKALVLKNDDSIDTVAKNTEEPTKKEIEKTSPLKRPVRIIKSAKRDPKKKPVVLEDSDKVSKPSDKVAKTENKSKTPNEKNSASPSTKTVDGEPLSVGSLIGYATKRVNPTYPRQARTMRMTGIVKVELIIDEKGKVSKIGSASGPSLLKRAARAAALKWRFRPFKKDGMPVKATGFVSFNFNL